MYFFLFNHPTDYADFGNAQLQINHPSVFVQHTTFYVQIFGDDIYELQEELVVSLLRPNILIVPAPFKAKKTASPLNSVVKKPGDNRINFQLSSTKIIIRGGK